MFVTRVRATLSLSLSHRGLSLFLSGAGCVCVSRVRCPLPLLTLLLLVSVASSVSRSLTLVQGRVLSRPQSAQGNTSRLPIVYLRHHFDPSHPSGPDCSGTPPYYPRGGVCLNTNTANTRPHFSSTLLPPASGCPCEARREAPLLRNTAPPTTPLRHSSAHIKKSCSRQASSRPWRARMPSTLARAVARCASLHLKKHTAIAS